jgi:hypothetical protein
VGEPVAGSVAAHEPTHGHAPGVAEATTTAIGRGALAPPRRPPARLGGGAGHLDGRLARLVPPYAGRAVSLERRPAAVVEPEGVDLPAHFDGRVSGAPVRPGQHGRATVHPPPDAVLVLALPQLGLAHPLAVRQAVDGLAALNANPGGRGHTVMVALGVDVAVDLHHRIDDEVDSVAVKFAHDLDGVRAVLHQRAADPQALRRPTVAEVVRPLTVHLDLRARPVTHPDDDPTRQIAERGGIAACAPRGHGREPRIDVGLIGERPGGGEALPAVGGWGAWVSSPRESAGVGRHAASRRQARGGAAGMRVCEGKSIPTIAETLRHRGCHRGRGDRRGR